MTPRSGGPDDAKRAALRIVALAFAAAAATACAYLTGSSVPPVPDAPCCAGAPDDLSAVYLGSGGWILEWDGQMVLGAPLFTNPSMLTVGLGSIRSDTALVEALLPPVRDARAILVGHAHYDHLLDVPWTARRAAPDAWILTNQTAANILAGDPELDPARVHVMNERAGDRDSPGHWVTLPGDRVRVMPLLTEHAPHFQGVELFGGTVDRPMDILPTAARDWVGGQGIAYLIDFLDRPGGTVAYRVYYTDITASAPWGYPPPLPPNDEHRVDLAVIIPSSFHETEWFPEGVTQALDPRHVALGHWENFFVPWSRDPDPLVFMDLEVFVTRLERALSPGSVWTLPRPGDTLKIPMPPD